MPYDQLEEIEEFPSPSRGAPIPSIVGTELQLFVLYYVDNQTSEFDGKSVLVVDADTTHQPTAMVSFKRVRNFKFGEPSHNTISSHPLYAQGLYPSAVFEVKHSSWVAEIERLDLEDDWQKSSATSSTTYRHLIFTFHDSTFECICESASAELLDSSLRLGIRRCLEMLD